MDILSRLIYIKEIKTIIFLVRLATNHLFTVSIVTHFLDFDRVGIIQSAAFSD